VTNVPTTSPTGNGLRVTVTIAAGGAVATGGVAIVAGHNGCGYAATNAVTVDASWLGGGTQDLVFPVNAITNDFAATAANFTKGEDTDG